MKRGDIAEMNDSAVVDGTRVCVDAGTTALVLGISIRDDEDNKFDLVRVLAEGYILRLYRFKLDPVRKKIS